MKRNAIWVLSMLSMAAGMLPVATRAEVSDVFAGIAKDANGNVLRMNQPDAEAYCSREKQGQHLATARELALFAKSLGARGPSETETRGSYLVKGSDGAGNPDDFYFDSRGYEFPDGELGEAWFWSSSRVPGDPEVFYGLEGDSGFIGKGIYRNSGGVVLCVP